MSEQENVNINVNENGSNDPTNTVSNETAAVEGTDAVSDNAITNDPAEGSAKDSVPTKLFDESSNNDSTKETIEADVVNYDYSELQEVVGENLITDLKNLKLDPTLIKSAINADLMYNEDGSINPKAINQAALDTLIEDESTRALFKRVVDLEIATHNSKVQTTLSDVNAVVNEYFNEKELKGFNTWYNNKENQTVVVNALRDALETSIKNGDSVGMRSALGELSSMYSNAKGITRDNTTTSNANVVATKSNSDMNSLSDVDQAAFDYEAGKISYREYAHTVNNLVKFK